MGEQAMESYIETECDTILAGALEGHKYTHVAAKKPTEYGFSNFEVYKNAPPGS